MAGDRCAVRRPFAFYGPFSYFWGGIHLVPMKHILFYIVLWLLLSVLACTGGDARAVLAQADSLLPTLPDSALRLLQSLSPRDLPDREGRMYYALLLSHAKYRNYIPLGSDSLLQEVAAYYAGRGDDRLEARARYLLGGVYAERQEADRAFKTYHEAARLARQAQDGRTLCLTLHQWAYLCQNHGMAARGDSLYAETARLARQVGDSVRWAEALLRRGAYALSLGDSAYPRAEQLIGEGYKLARRLHSVQLFRLAYLTQSVLYSSTGRMRQALAEVKEYLDHVREDTVGLAKGCLLLGGVYFQINQKDSADIYLCRALKADDYAVRESACILLARIAEAEGNYKRLARWEQKRTEYRSKRQVLEQEIRIAVAAKEVELMQALWKRDSRISFLLGGIVLLVLLFGGGWLVWWLTGRQKKRLRLQAQPLVLGTSGVRPVEWNYSAFRQQMQETESYRLIESILDYYKRSAGYECRWTLNERDAFFEQVNDLLPDHRKALEERFPQLTLDEVFCCYLYMLGLSDEQVGVLFERSRITAYRRRISMMRAKMGLADSGIDALVQACHIASGDGERADETKM